MTDKDVTMPRTAPASSAPAPTTPPPDNAFTLAACAEMIHTGLPFAERARRIAERGLKVEMWDWTAKDLPSLGAMRADGVEIVSMTGYTQGDLTTDDGVAQFLATAEESLRAAETIDCPRLNVHGTGLGEGGIPVVANAHPTPSDWLRAADTLRRLAELGQAAGRVFTLENLNLAVDHPGCPFARAEETRALVTAVDSPHLRMNLDLYHAQIGEGNLIELCRDSQDWIGEIQVADVPGRCQPGSGEINYRAIARALAAMGYRRTVAMEAFASDDSDAALDDFIEAFSVAAGGEAR